MKRSRCKEGNGIDVRIRQHLIEVARGSSYTGFQHPSFKRGCIDITQMYQPAIGMVSKAVHPGSTEPQADDGNI